ncbi:hypothetical protein S245_051090, partial [Arachis hypogaea]
DLTKGGIRTAGVCTTLLKKLRQIPLNATQKEVSDLSMEVDELKRAKSKLEAERTTLKLDAAFLRNM